ncbi:MAG: hypothetical protein ABEL97_07840 [Salinibacter sp.]
MSRNQINPKVRETLLELKRHPEPCLLNLRSTTIAAKTIDRVGGSGPTPIVRVTGTDGSARDIPLRLIESVDIPGLSAR